jgi:hypothetical protein
MPGEEPSDALRRFLAERRLLLVLDNVANFAYAHVAEEAGLVLAGYRRSERGSTTCARCRASWTTSSPIRTTRARERAARSTTRDRPGGDLTRRPDEP